MQLLTYWKTNATIKTGVATSQNTNYLQVSFVRRPAEAGVTYHVQRSTNLIDWVDVATYAGSNIVLAPQALEVSRTGSPNERVTIRDNSILTGKAAGFLRVNVTRP